MTSPRRIARVLVVGLIGLASGAAAEDVIPGHRIDRPVNGAVIAGALGATLGLSLIPIRTERALWSHELFGALDGAVHDAFSLRAAVMSDGLLAASLLAPIGYLTGATTEDVDGDRLVVYGESLAVNLAVFQGVKHLVQRPRPYLYSTSPDVARYAAAQGDDGYRSFYSAHAATAFCAATAGAYLAAASAPSSGARAFAWGGGFAAAAAAANLRVRAGKHFYSDVVVGSIVGVAIGYAVPALHADREPYVPDAADLGAAAAGVLGGVLASQLLPIGGRRDDAFTNSRLARLRRANLRFGPAAISDGTGVGIGGTL